MSFRFLHTADWHLGRVFHGVSLLEDQAHALDQVIAIAAGSRVDALLVAGDVYDRAVPPTDAVRLLDEVLARVALDLRCPVIVIAGNHDSPGRLGFGAALMVARGCHLRGPLVADLTPVRLGDADRPVLIYPIPYADPALVRERLAAPDATGHDAAMAAIVANIAARIAAGRDGEPGARRIALAHCFVTGATVSDSERPLSVGGTGEVAASHFAGFDYCALGHLHRPQALGERIGYAGSLLKYSFGEAGHQKSVSLVELGADGAVRVERVPLTPRRDLRVVSGHLADLLAGPQGGESADDYLLIDLLDRGALLDPLARLREVWPNTLQLTRSGLFGAAPTASVGAARLLANEEALFADFFAEVTGDPLAPDEQTLLAEVIGSVRAAEREEPDA